MRLAVLFPLRPVGSVLKASELIKCPAGHEYQEHKNDKSGNHNQHFEWFEFRCHDGRRRKTIAGERLAAS
jgi:hypothetical protein